MRRAPPADPAPDDVGGRASRDASCRVLFKQGRTELADAKAFDRCMKSTRAELAAAGSDAEIVLYGFASEEGTTDFNQKLSQDRAQAVKDWMVAHGLEDERIQTRGAGSSEPLADNKSAAGRAKNRRIEF